MADETRQAKVLKTIAPVEHEIQQRFDYNFLIYGASRLIWLALFVFMAHEYFEYAIKVRKAENAIQEISLSVGLAGRPLLAFGAAYALNQVLLSFVRADMRDD